MNPTAPSLYTTINLHKPNAPIRPIINWKNEPAYELAKQLTKTLQNYLNLPYIYDVRNSNQLVTELKTIELNNNIRMCSFDIKNMCTNAPRKHIINVINNILENNIEIQSKIQREIIYILKLIMEQNYFQFDQKYYKQTEGLAMGDPTSAILAETFIQHTEHDHLYPILIAHEIIAYYRYDDDIFIIYDENQTNIEQTLYEFNSIQPSIKIYHGKRTARKNQLFGYYYTSKG
jgi:hypothetical protein